MGTQLETQHAQKLFEKQLFYKSTKQSSSKGGSTNYYENDIMICDNYVSVFRCYHDMSIYVLGNADDNELILGQVLDCLHECFDKVFKSQFERRALITQMSQVILIIDEIVDHGVVMHTQSSVILQRIKTVKKAESTGIAAAVQEEQQASSSLFGSVFASARSGLSKQMGF